MKKPNKEIEAASDEQLAEWSAVFVMGEDPKTYRYTNYFKGWGVRREKPQWNPAQNIGQAFEIAEKLNDMGWTIWIERPIYLNWHVTFAKGDGEINDIVDYHCENKLLSRAITKAALMAAGE